MTIHLHAEAIAVDQRVPVSRAYAWLAFALIVGLMLSDYVSRQVINPIFPLLKSQWALSDAQLGSLASIVALVVGVMTFPVSLVADRIGRVKSATAMAIVWGAATVACGLAGNFTTMLVARAVVGLGEAGYGSAGGAILTHLFPRRLHATVMGAFLAAALFGSVRLVGRRRLSSSGPAAWRWRSSFHSWSKSRPQAGQWVQHQSRCAK
jgi:MFS family permease